MQTHKLNKKAIAVTGLPEGAEDPKVIDHIGGDWLFWNHQREWPYHTGVPLPPGNWRILGRAVDLKEEDWKLVVEYNSETGFFKAYSTDLGFIWNTATESAQSLLKSKGLYVSNPYGHHPSKWEYLMEAQHKLKDDIKCWDEAQLLTNPLILIIE